MVHIFIDPSDYLSSSLSSKWMAEMSSLVRNRWNNQFSDSNYPFLLFAYGIPGNLGSYLIYNSHSGL